MHGKFRFLDFASQKQVFTPLSLSFILFLLLRHSASLQPTQNPPSWNFLSSGKCSFHYVVIRLTANFLSFGQVVYFADAVVNIVLIYFGFARFTRLHPTENLQKKRNFLWFLWNLFQFPRVLVKVVSKVSMNIKFLIRFLFYLSDVLLSTYI